jgi:hypothetical protein
MGRPNRRWPQKTLEAQPGRCSTLTIVIISIIISIIMTSHHDHHHMNICHPYEQYVEWGDSINFIFMMMMMMNDVHFDIPLLANFKNLQLFHDSGAEQRQGCTELV